MVKEKEEEKIKEEKVIEVNSATGEVRCCTAKSLPPTNKEEDKEEEEK